VKLQNKGDVKSNKLGGFEMLKNKAAFGWHITEALNRLRNLELIVMKKENFL